MTQRRQQAASIAAFGDRARDILITAWDGSGFAYGEQQLGSLGRSIVLTAERHQAYPVLHYFHSADRRSAFAPNVAALDEALHILKQTDSASGPGHSSPAVDVTQQVIRDAIQLLRRHSPRSPAALRRRPITDAAWPGLSRTPDGRGTMSSID